MKFQPFIMFGVTATLAQFVHGWKGIFNKRQVAGFLLPLSLTNPSISIAADKVAVFGGTGFVGSHVVRDLTDQGVDVISISRSGKVPSWAVSQKWSEKVEWRKGDPTISTVLTSSDEVSAVVSTIGVIGLNNDILEKSNGAANIAAIKQAKDAGAKRFIYVGVGSIVPKAFAGNILPGYFSGKAEAETAVKENFGESGIIVKPTFIYGGDEFSVNPPRVPDGYGSLVNAVLSSGPLRLIASISPPLLKVALVPPISVDRIAHAIAAGEVVPGAYHVKLMSDSEGAEISNTAPSVLITMLSLIAGALGRLTENTILDGSDAINAAADLL